MEHCLKMLRGDINSNHFGDRKYFLACDDDVWKVKAWMVSKLKKKYVV